MMARLAYKLFWLEDTQLLSYYHMRQLSKKHPYARYHWVIRVVSRGEKRRNVGALVATLIEATVLNGRTE